MTIRHRLNRLEKQQPEEKVFAFIGVPEGSEYVFDVARRFWDENRDRYPDSRGIHSALPFRHYQGRNPSYLGLGTFDDFRISVGGTFDFSNANLLFYRDVEDRLKMHWNDFRKLLEKARVKEDAVEIVGSEAPEGMLQLLTLMAERYTFGDV